MSTFDHNNKINLLISETQQLNATVRELVDKLPQLKKEWLNPGEFAKIADCSTKSLTNWRVQGKIQANNWKNLGTEEKPSFQYHRDRALADVQLIVRPKPSHLEKKKLQ